MYDLFSMEDEFIARCPLNTIRLITGCHPDALRRIEREIAAGEPVVKLWNGSRYLVVTPAVGAR